MEQIQAWLVDSRHLTAAAAFLASVVAAFVAGYLVGHAGRERPASPAPAPATRPAPAKSDDGGPLPEIGGEEARLMDLTAIREAEAEPPPPLGPEPPRRR